jgi:hypothetical protein
MSENRVASSQAAAARLPAQVGPLSANDVWRLTLFKWRYSLESHGFTTEQARQLLFLKWLYGSGADLS